MTSDRQGAAPAAGGIDQARPGEAGATEVEVLVVGSGFSGLCMGVQLKAAGIDDFAILEKDAVFGGTWRVNHYPGAACDVPSHLYSFSFAQNAEWSRKFPSQAELLRYTERVAEQFGLHPHLCLDTALLSADYDEASRRWLVRTTRGAWRARSLVLATGGLSAPVLPPLPGLAAFAGTLFHSARWDHGVELRGKRVAVIGTGASAIQFVPRIAGQTFQLDLYQRTAPWILPRPDRAISGVERALLRRVKPLQWLYRALTYAQYESRYLAFARWPLLMRATEALCRHHLRRQIPHDAALRARLTPTYQAGCKRLLLSSDYYPALTRPNVELVTSPIAEVRAHSIVTADGRERAVDVIVVGTGFDAFRSYTSVAVRGRAGALLGDAAREGLEAYKGAAVCGFPNLFLITGPNTGLGHNSMLLMIESNVRYVVQALQALHANAAATLEVRADVCARYNATLQQRLRGTVWSSGCKSWYLNANGKNSTLWPGFTFTYRRITRRFDREAYLPMV